MYGPRSPWFFDNPKLMIRDITGSHRIEAALDRSGRYCDHTILCAHRLCDQPASLQKADRGGARRTSSAYSLELLQAVVASRLVSAYYYWCLTGEGVRTGGGFHTYPTTVRALPIPNLDVLRDPSNQKTVSEMECLSKRLATTAASMDGEPSPSKRERLQRRFESDDARLDALLYSLYELDESEIVRIEEASAG